MPSGSDDDAMKAFSQRAQRRQPLTLATPRSGGRAPASRSCAITSGDAADRPSPRHPSTPPPPPPPPADLSSKLGLRLPVNYTRSRPLQPVHSSETSDPISPLMLEPKTYAPTRADLDSKARSLAGKAGDVAPSSSSPSQPDGSTSLTTSCPGQSSREDDPPHEERVTILGETPRTRFRDTVCLRPNGQVLVLKRVDPVSGRWELDLLRSLRHDNIVAVRAAYEGWGSDLLLDLQPARYTLAEIMVTHLGLQMREVRSVASAVSHDTGGEGARSSSSAEDAEEDCAAPAANPPCCESPC